MRYVIFSILALPFSAALGFTIEYLAPYKTMTIKLLWAFIPTVLLMIYASLLGAVLLHKITDRLFGIQRD